MIDDIVYLKKAVRLGTQSHGLNIPRLNKIIDTLQEKAEKWDLYLEKGSASESFLEEENKRLKDFIKEKDLYILSHPHEYKEIVEKIKTGIKKLEEYKTAVNDETKDYPYINIESIIKELKELLATKEGNC